MDRILTTVLYVVGSLVGITITIAIWSKRQIRQFRERVTYIRIPGPRSIFPRPDSAQWPMDQPVILKIQVPQRETCCAGIDKLATVSPQSQHRRWAPRVAHYAATK